MIYEYKNYFICWNEKYEAYHIYINLTFGRAFDYRFDTLYDAKNFIDERDSK